MSATQVRAYAGKAEEYTAAAVSDLEAGRCIDGAAIESDLRRLLPLKTKAEYEPDDVAPSVATKAVARAQRCTLVARRVANAVT